MEIVLLWLDDLDDLLFTLSLVWERGRRVALQVGLAAAFCLAGVEVMAVESSFAPLTASVAAASVAAWALGAVFSAYYALKARIGTA